LRENRILGQNPSNSRPGSRKFSQKIRFIGYRALRVYAVCKETQCEMDKKRYFSGYGKGDGRQIRLRLPDRFHTAQA
jgi:hypothetical protein